MKLLNFAYVIMVVEHRRDEVMVVKEGRLS